MSDVYVTPRNYAFRVPLPARGLRLFGDFLHYNGDAFILLRGFRFDGCSVKVRIFGVIDVGISDGPLTSEGLPEMYWPSAVHDAGYEFVVELAAHFNTSVWTIRKVFDDAFLREALTWCRPGSDRPRVYYKAVRHAGWVFVLRRYARAVGWWRALRSMAVDKVRLYEQSRDALFPVPNVSLDAQSDQRAAVSADHRAKRFRRAGE
jgi:hypothetical protein